MEEHIDPSQMSARDREMMGLTDETVEDPKAPETGQAKLLEGSRDANGLASFEASQADLARKAEIEKGRGFLDRKREELAESWRNGEIADRAKFLLKGTAGAALMAGIGMGSAWLGQQFTAESGANLATGAMYLMSAGSFGASALTEAITLSGALQPRRRRE